MNIDHASPQSFAAPTEKRSGLRSFLLGLGLAAFALVALVITAILLFLSARAQMQFQTSPTDVKYGPVQRIPTSAPESRAADETDEEDEDGSPSSPVLPGGGIVPGIPGITGGPLFPSAPQAPAYTPVPAAPERTSPKAGAAPDSKRRTAEDGQPAIEPSAPAARPPKSARTDRSVSETGRIRRVGGKSFKRNETGALVDTAYVAGSGLKELTFVAGSDEYVRLLEERQDLRPYFRLDDQLIVVVDNIVYRVVPKD